MFRKLLFFSNVGAGASRQARTALVERTDEEVGGTHPGSGSHDSLSAPLPVLDMRGFLTQKLPFLWSLPQELLDYVVDFLHDDFTTLRTCSLVCRAWVSASSFHLFSQLRWPPCEHNWITMNPKILLSSSHCKCHLHDSPGTLDHLRTLLISSPRISSNVRSLNVKLGLYNSRDDVFHRRYMQTAATPQQLDNLLDLIPQVQALEISSLHFENQSSHAPFKLKGHIEELVLSLTAQELETGCQYTLDFIASFASIDFLSVQCDLDISPTRLLAPSRLARPTFLELLICTKKPIPMWLGALFARTDLEVLTGLSLIGDAQPHRDVHATTQAVLHTALRKCTALRSITCNDATSRSVLACPGACPTLRKLRFRGSHRAQARLSADHWSTISELMRCPLASTVDLLDVILTYGTVSVLVSQAYSCQAMMSEYLSSINWGRLNDSMKKLKTLDIRLSLSLEQVWKVGKAPKNARTEPAFREWRREVAKCRIFLEEGIKANILPQSRCDIRVFVSLTALRYQ